MSSAVTQHVRLDKAIALLQEHRTAHGSAASHECSCDRSYQLECPEHGEPEAKVAQFWRRRRDDLLGEVGL